MPELRDLSQQVILDHNKTPRPRGRIGDPSHTAEGNNPLCGDRITVFLKVEDGIIRDIGFEGSGCAISTASASLMTEFLRGKTIAEAVRLFDRFHDLVAGDPTDHETVQPELGKLNVFAGVREFPSRVKCATLSWHTLHAALKNVQDAVTTE